ncbi:hypothetical protein MNB_SV-5-59 [hydrothermal vent metagenome]|uniref:DUF1022 domain-containing protein n=1 Tax=hydrothermal vent metagenome TaxID=652676 RepID=A0A1W1EEF3_9ZZZZ
MSRVLILSDGRLGHLNQSIALAKYANIPYDIYTIKPKFSFTKALTYIFDKLNFKTKILFDNLKLKDEVYTSVVGTGSLCYYMVKVLSEELKCSSVVMMLPKGYKFNFTTIFAQKHDNPPILSNIITLPANFSYIEPKNIYVAKKKSIGIVIGGDNSVFTFSKDKLRIQLNFIKKHYSDYEIALTTSPRTSLEIEDLITSYDFEYKVIFSKNPINPIPDFLEQCEFVFITADSTSMISEAISYGNSNIVVLPLQSKKENKFERFIKELENESYLYVFDGKIENKNRKIDFTSYLHGVEL